MFEFLLDAGNYEDRKIDKTEFNWGYISTCRVSDGRQPYETAICSNEYAKSDELTNTSGMIIIESYDSIKNAKSGHVKWCKIMRNDPPQELVDCCNAGLGQLIEMVDSAPKEIRTISRIINDKN